MSSLFGGISISLRALLTQQAAVNTTADNISNVNTPGFARRRIVMAEDSPILVGSLTFGNGVHADRIESLRDRVLELRIDEESQQQGAWNGYLESLGQIESVLGDVDNGIGAQIDAFFASVDRLSADPANLPLRQNVLTAAGNLAESFQNAVQRLGSLRQNIDSGISDTVMRVNALSSQIADLNVEIGRTSRLGGDSSVFEDNRTELIRQLSELVNISVIPNDDGITITTGNGTALVVGDTAYSLEAQRDGSGVMRVFAQDKDITGALTEGKIGGLLRSRDQAISSITAELSSLASNLATNVNAAHQNGFDLNGVAGTKLFSESTVDSAANFKVLISDPRLLAASSDGSVGDNSNLKAISNIRDLAILSGQTATEFFASLVARVGSDIAVATAQQEAGASVLQQLSNQRAAISGVSLDEEAANLIRYQRAYEASARVISVIDELCQTVLSMGRS